MLLFDVCVKTEQSRFKTQKFLLPDGPITNDLIRDVLEHDYVSNLRTELVEEKIEEICVVAVDENFNTAFIFPNIEDVMPHGLAKIIKTNYKTKKRW